MGDKLQSVDDIKIYQQERSVISKLRDAIGFCKSELEITTTFARQLTADEKINFEKCLTKNYLVKYGDDYFGKRDLIHLDLYSHADIRQLDELA
eukprot:403345064